MAICFCLLSGKNKKRKNKNNKTHDLLVLLVEPCLSSEYDYHWLRKQYLNPFSPNSDQQQFSPNNIHTLSRDKVMRINKMIIIEKIPWPFIKFSQLILKGDVWRSVWRICMWILGLKVLIQSRRTNLMWPLVFHQRT